jgi:small subunit ribosomal protein S21
MGKRLVSVKVRNGDINRALKKFKRGVIESGHIFELKDRQEYTKPTTKRRKQKQQAIRDEYIRRLKNEEIESPRKNKKKRK